MKNHGTAKAAIYLFTAGDISPDGNGDGEMDILPWKWRYDYFGAIVRDYFGVQPLLKLHRHQRVLLPWRSTAPARTARPCGR